MQAIPLLLHVSEIAKLLYFLSFLFNFIILLLSDVVTKLITYYDMLIYLSLLES